MRLVSNLPMVLLVMYLSFDPFGTITIKRAIISPKEIRESYLHFI